MKIEIPDWIFEKFKRWFKVNFNQEATGDDLIKILEEEANYWD